MSAVAGAGPPPLTGAKVPLHHRPALARLGPLSANCPLVVELHTHAFRASSSVPPTASSSLSPSPGILSSLLPPCSPSAYPLLVELLSLPSSLSLPSPSRGVSKKKRPGDYGTDVTHTNHGSPRHHKALLGRLEKVDAAKQIIDPLPCSIDLSLSPSRHLGFSRCSEKGPVDSCLFQRVTTALGTRNNPDHLLQNANPPDSSREREKPFALARPAADARQHLWLEGS